MAASPNRPNGMPLVLARVAIQSARLCALSARASKRRCHCPESTRPSRIEFTRICGANSVASDFSKLCTPARAAEVHTICASGWAASSEFTPTMAGAVEASSSGRRARIGRIWLKNFRSSSCRQSSSLVLAKVETRPWPALLTSRSSRPPDHSDTDAANAATASRSSTSQDTASRLSIRAFSSSESLAAANRALSRPQMATFAPSASRMRAVARPMPDVPPVTTAMRPEYPRFMPPPSNSDVDCACSNQADAKFPRRRRRLPDRSRPDAHRLRKLRPDR